MTDREANVTDKVNDLVIAWEASKNSVNYARRRLAEANESMQAAANELGDHLTPDDAKPGEAFQIWYGSQILRVEKSVAGDDGYKVSWRSRQ